MSSIGDSSTQSNYDEIDNDYKLCDAKANDDNNTSQKPNRCGEILLLNNNFFIICRYCGNLLNNFELFSKHIFDVHINNINLIQNDATSIKLKTSVEVSPIYKDYEEIEVYSPPNIEMIDEKIVEVEVHDKQTVLNANKEDLEIIEEEIVSESDNSDDDIESKDYEQNESNVKDFEGQFYNYCEHFNEQTEELENHFVEENYNEESHRNINKIINQEETSCISEDTMLSDIIEKDMNHLQKKNCEVIVSAPDSKSKKNKKVYGCPNCTRFYTRFDSLKIHYRNHTGEKNPYKCNICDKTFSAPCKLLVHKRVHTGERPFQCHLCPQAFKAKQKLNNHLESHQKGTIRMPKVFIDGVSKQERQPARLPILIENKFVLPAHTRREDGLFYCPLCDRKYRRFESLKEHAQCHIEPKQYECHHCNKRFNKIRTLKIHVKSHLPNANTRWKDSAGGPVTCDYCEKTFNSRYYLNEHISGIHSGEKSHECSICKRTFAFKNNYSLHMRTHCGDKRYKCSYCDLKFIQSTTKLRHERVVHLNELPFKCLVCQQEFQKSSDLKNHMKSNHPEENDNNVNSNENVFIEDVYYESNNNDTVTEQTIIVADSFEKNSVNETSNDNYDSGNSNSSVNNTNDFICSDCGAYFQDYEKFCSHCATHGVNLNELYVIEYMDSNNAIIEEINS